jgi:tRNA dimethylallyltransferase
LANPNNKRVIVICGPTAVGKTTVAIDIAKQFNTSIISADSRQCYKELKVGVARPSDRELAQVKHYFIASHTIHEEVTAAGFERYALEKVNELFVEHDAVIMVGGTGLYIKAFCEGLDEIPSIDPTTRETIVRSYERNGLSWLQQEVRTKDPEFYKVGEIHNPQRMMRALEVLESTGKSVLHFRKGKKAVRDFQIIKLGLELPKEELHERINTRVDKMIEAGLVDEVKRLVPYKNLNALQTVGYSEIFDCIDGKGTLEKAVEEIKKNTRQYAKRQMTWFRRDPEIRWLDAGKVLDFGF